MTPFVAEILGTFMLMLLGCGVNANVSLNKTFGNNSGWIVITTGWALAVFAGVVVSSDISGAHLNPAVTIGLAVAGKFAWSQVANFILAQMIGASLGAFMVWLNYRNHFNSTEDQGAQLGTFSTSPAIPDTLTNFLCEMTGTFVLIIAVLFIAGASMDPGGANTPIGLGSIGALPVALIVFSIGLSLGGTTGYAINPARDLGPRIIHQLVPMTNKGSSGWKYAWIPILGPISGAVVAGLLFSSLT